jgi:hypothetical protein
LGPNLQGAGVLDLKGIFNQMTANKPNPSGLQEILGYQLLETLLNRIGIKSSLFQKKRDEALNKTLSSLTKVP